MSSGAANPANNTHARNGGMAQALVDWIIDLGDVVIGWFVAVGDVTLFAVRTFRWLLFRWLLSPAFAQRLGSPRTRMRERRPESL